MLSEMAYYVNWELVSGTQHGQVPFAGRKCYLVGFRDGEFGLRFAFSGTDQMYAPVEALLQWNIEDDRYYRVTEPDWEILRNMTVVL